MSGIPVVPNPSYVESSNPLTPNLKLALDGMSLTLVSNFQILDTAVGSGGSSTAIQTVTGNYQPLQTDGTILCNGSLTVTLVTTLNKGTTFRIKNIGTSAVIVSSSVNIDTSNTYTLNPYTGVSIDVQWDGTQWWVL